MSIFTTNVIDLEALEEELLEESLNLVEEVETTNDSNICSFCGTTFNKSRYDCPECGTIVARRFPKREITPIRTLIREVESRNNNGSYKIYRLTDGTPFCNCLSFLFQRGIEIDNNGIVQCKHIRQARIDGYVNVEITAKKKITEWQEILLKKLGVKISEELSSEQAYWVVYEILKKMGVEYNDFVALLKETPNYELLPLYSFGVELEGLVRSKEELKNKLNENGIQSYLTGYSHEIRNKQWKLGDDGSVRDNMSSEERSSYQSVEITSPKLFGKEGFEEIEKVCRFWNEVGAAVNTSCGFHVHVSAWDYTQADLRRLFLVWMRIENVVQFLVSPSRRNNRYCRLLRESEFSRVFYENITVGDRYLALNLNPYNTYKTIEFRIHQGTSNPEKIINWVIFCLKLVEKVKKGLKWYHFSDEPTIEEVLDKLGINERGFPMLKRARGYFIERYNHFYNENYRLVSFRDIIDNFSCSRYYGRNYLIGSKNTNDRHYVNLAKLRTQRNNFIPYETMLSFVRDENLTKFEVILPNRTTSHTVTVNENGEVSCSCRIFRERESCAHSINVAYFLFYEKIIKKLDF